MHWDWAEVKESQPSWTNLVLRWVHLDCCNLVGWLHLDCCNLVGWLHLDCCNLVGWLYRDCCNLVGWLYLDCWFRCVTGSVWSSWRGGSRLYTAARPPQDPGSANTFKRTKLYYASLQLWEEQRMLHSGDRGTSLTPPDKALTTACLSRTIRLRVQM